MIVTIAIMPLLVILENDGTLEELRTKMIQMVHGLRGGE